jgi:hypothetical protein
MFLSAPQYRGVHIYNMDNLIPFILGDLHLKLIWYILGFPIKLLIIWIVLRTVLIKARVDIFICAPGKWQTGNGSFVYSIFSCGSFSPPNSKKIKVLVYLCYWKIRIFSIVKVTFFFNFLKKILGCVSVFKSAVSNECKCSDESDWPSYSY